MKKFGKILVLSLGLVFILSACSGEEGIDQALDRAKGALESRDYDRALKDMERALKDGLEDSNIEKTIEIIKTYKKAKACLSKGEVKEAMAYLKEIDSTYKSLTIKEDVDKLRSDLKEAEILIREYGDLLTSLSKEKSEDARKLLDQLNARYEELESIEAIDKLINQINREIEKYN